MLKQVLIAVDIGNARIKLGLFDPAGIDTAQKLPEPIKTLSLVGDAPDFALLASWLDKNSLQNELTWQIASVNRPMASCLIEWLKENRPSEKITMLAAGDLQLKIAVPRPDMVGIDRLVDAVAANRLREAGRPAVIVDVGSAITVDYVSADGVFCGGAILPGIAMSAKALFEFTDLLPLIDVSEFDKPPPVIGIDTTSAMQAGLFWGAVGAISRLVEEFSRIAGQTSSENAMPEVFLTGGAGRQIAGLLGPEVRYEPDLTLAGIALTKTT